MYFVKVNDKIIRIFDLFYRIGLWYRGEEATARETKIKLFYSFHFLLFPISLMAGAITTDNSEESIFLIETAVITTAMSIKFYYLIWKKREFIEFLHRIGIYSIDNHEEFTLINDKLNMFMKFTTFFVFSMIFSAAVALLGIPFVGSERNLFFNVAFPLDYKNSDTKFWIAYAFIFSEVILCVISCLVSVLMWYLLLNCGLKYEVLADQLRNLGVVRTVAVVTTVNERKISEAKKGNLYQRDLIKGIISHLDINEYY